MFFRLRCVWRVLEVSCRVPCRVVSCYYCCCFVARKRWLPFGSSFCVSAACGGRIRGRGWCCCMRMLQSFVLFPLSLDALRSDAFVCRLPFALPCLVAALSPSEGTRSALTAPSLRVVAGLADRICGLILKLSGPSSVGLLLCTVFYVVYCGSCGKKTTKFHREVGFPGHACY